MIVSMACFIVMVPFNYGPYGGCFQGFNSLIMRYEQDVIIGILMLFVTHAQTCLGSSIQTDQKEFVLDFLKVGGQSIEMGYHLTLSQKGYIVSRAWLSKSQFGFYDFMIPHAQNNPDLSRIFAIVQDQQDCTILIISNDPGFL